MLRPQAHDKERFLLITAETQRTRRKKRRTFFWCCRLVSVDGANDDLPTPSRIKRLPQTFNCGRLRPTADGCSLPTANGQEPTAFVFNLGPSPLIIADGFRLLAEAGRSRSGIPFRFAHFPRAPAARR